VSASAFRYHATQLINQIHVGPTFDLVAFANVGEMDAAGVEVEAEGRFSRMQGLTSYSYQQARDEDDAEWLTNSPRHVARVRIGATVVPRLLFAGVEGLYMSARRTLDDGRAPETLVANLTVTTRELGRFKTAFSIGNLFDRPYADPGAEEHPSDLLPQVGRTIRARVAWRF
jgi:outer membrane receptor protein involved in Fe transport